MEWLIIPSVLLLYLGNYFLVVSEYLKPVRPRITQIGWVQIRWGREFSLNDLTPNQMEEFILQVQFLQRQKGSSPEKVNWKEEGF